MDYALDNLGPGTRGFGCPYSALRHRESVIATHIRASRIGDIVLVAVDGPIRAGESELAFLGAMEGILNGGDRQVILDLSSVPHVDSTGLGRILQAVCRFQRSGGILKLLRPSNYVRNLLVITRVHTMVEVVDSLDVALAGFRSAVFCGPA